MPSRHHRKATASPHPQTTQSAWNSCRQFPRTVQQSPQAYPNGNPPLSHHYWSATPSPCLPTGWQCPSRPCFLPPTHHTWQECKPDGRVWTLCKWWSSHIQQSRQHQSDSLSSSCSWLFSSLPPGLALSSSSPVGVVWIACPTHQHEQSKPPPAPYSYHAPASNTFPPRR